MDQDEVQNSIINTLAWISACLCIRLLPVFGLFYPSGTSYK